MIGIIQSELIIRKLKELANKFELSKNNTIIRDSGDQLKVRGIDDFELKWFDLTKVEFS